MCLSADVQIYTKYMHCMLNTFCMCNDAKYSIIVPMVICSQLKDFGYFCFFHFAGIYEVCASGIAVATSAVNGCSR